jgi:proteic killer suppression protein
MILSYRDNRTRAFAAGRSRESQGFARQTYRRLEILDAAMSLAQTPPFVSISLG